MIGLTIVSGVSQIVDDICSEKMQRYLRLQTIKKVSELGIDNFDNPTFYDNVNQSIINSRNMDNLISDAITLGVTLICTLILLIMIIMNGTIYLLEELMAQII